MVHKFETSLNVEEYKNTLQHRAYLTNIAIASKHKKIVIKNCRMRLQGINYHIPYILKISNTNEKTIIKGCIGLPKHHYISLMVVYLVFSVGVFTISDAKIYISLIFLLVTALFCLCITKFLQYSFNVNFCIDNGKVMELLESIENDFPI